MTLMFVVFAGMAKVFLELLYLSMKMMFTIIYYGCVAVIWAGYYAILIICNLIVAICNHFQKTTE